MKKILILSIISLLAMVNVQAETKTDIELCKAFINKAKAYQSTMKEDHISQATFAFYKDEVVNNCGNIASSMPYSKDFFATQLMKSDRATAKNCKLSIKMAQTYVETEEMSPFLTHAHKVNIIDHCGTLVAKKESANCLFNVVDNSKEDLKERCVASIEKAHSAKNPDALKMHKEAVIANCGKLQANL
ncbi:MAG: hypothetical protein U9O64_06565 [Campylobacterota bacterium]|nr:hypothetical protein [Campylobacterota bacterium]